MTAISPFPGMDPYLELYWGDVHARLCTYICDALQPQIRPKLIARVEERLVIEAERPAPRSSRPDVRIDEDRGGRPIRRRQAAGGVGIAEPLILKYLKSESATEAFIHIIDPRSGDELVTAIEILSLSNKRAGRDHRRYRRNQERLADAGVSLVEIDLLRAGRWTVQATEEMVPESQRQPYRVCVHRSWGEMAYEFYHLPLRARLPKIRIPLREGDPDAVLDLRAVVNKVYANGAYDSLKYGRPADPPLRGEDAAWADALLVKAGKRKAARPAARPRRDA